MMATVTSEIPVETVTTVMRELAHLAACLLPRAPAVPRVGILAVEQVRAASVLHERLHVARRHVALLERVAPHDPIVLELRAEVELVTSRLVELGIINRSAFVRRSVPRMAGCFGGAARLPASACRVRTSSSCR